jgi:nucleotide-binding universal stress UspA family protein
MTCILAATDLSTRSDRAVQRALRLSVKLKLPCRIVSVVDNDMLDDMLADRVKDVTQWLDRFIGSLAVAGQVVTSSVVAGDPHQAILDQAEAHDATLLVLGLHRSRPFVDLFRDTTMVRIVRGSLRPVLLVNDPVDHDYARILVPVSFSPSCAAALRVARTIAPNAELRSFHAVPIPFQGLTGDGPGSDMARELCRKATKERDAWTATLDPSTLPCEIEIISGGRSETMARMAAGRPDLIAVGAHTRSGFSPNVLGSFVTDLIVRPSCDVLVARG